MSSTDTQPVHRRVSNWYNWLQDIKSPVPHNPNRGGDEKQVDVYDPIDGEWMESHVMSRFAGKCSADFKIFQAYLRDGLAAAGQLKMTTEALESKKNYCYIYINGLVRQAECQQ